MQSTKTNPFYKSVGLARLFCGRHGKDCRMQNCSAGFRPLRPNRRRLRNPHRFLRRQARSRCPQANNCHRLLSARRILYLLYVRRLFYIRFYPHDRGCLGVSIDPLGPINTSSPIVTGHVSKTVKLKFAKKFLPTVVKTP